MIRPRRLPIRSATLVAALALAQPAWAGPDAAEVSFRALYKGLVETDTTLSGGSCTRAATLAADHLAAAGMARENLHVLTAPGHPEEGNLVAV
ncbi:MAG TPA: peptidase M20, partial [Croceicoccus sp.]|nr:peptidase M20 [Croceicoccus sp.]